MRIEGYIKTNHFQKRQKERGVSDRELNYILSSLNCPLKNSMLIISRKILRRITNQKKEELFIKINGKILITCFYCDFQEYLRSKKKENYQIISTT